MCDSFKDSTLEVRNEDKLKVSFVLVFVQYKYYSS